MCAHKHAVRTLNAHITSVTRAAREHANAYARMRRRRYRNNRDEREELRQRVHQLLEASKPKLPKQPRLTRASLVLRGEYP